CTINGNKTVKTFILLIALTARVCAQSESSEPALIAALQAQTAALKTQVAALQKQVASINASSVMKIAPYVSVDVNPENFVQGPNIVFKGANIHIVNGMGRTDLTNGTGNLIIGYDENIGWDGDGTLINGYPE